VKVYNVTAAVLIPKVPNHLRLENGASLPVEAIDEAGLRAIGKAWTAALIEHAAARRKTVAAPAPEAKPS